MKSGEIYLVDKSHQYNEHTPHIELYVYVRRVLFFNEEWVFVDSKDDNGVWDLEKCRKGLFYFAPMKRRDFGTNALKIGFVEVQDKIKDWYQTNLPIYISRIKDCSWDSEIFERRDLLYAYLLKNQNQKWLDEVIATESIFLISIGKNRTPKTVTLIHAENKKYFTASELLWQAAVLQRSVYGYKSVGVGIFRAGSKAGIATYYIGEYLDRAAILSS